MSISTDYSSYSYSGLSGIQSAQSVNFNLSTSTGSTSSSGTSTKTTAIGDTASFSPEALFRLKQSQQTQQTQQKPEEMDFESMSDDEIKSFLSGMQERTGNLPSEFGNITSIEDMTSEEVQGVRDSLVAKQSEMAGLAAGRPSGPPPGGAPPSGAGGAGGGGGIAGIEEDEDEDEETELEKLMAAMEEAQEKKLEEEKEYQKRMGGRIDPNFSGMAQMMQRQMQSEESEAI